MRWVFAWAAAGLAAIVPIVWAADSGIPGIVSNSAAIVVGSTQSGGPGGTPTLTLTQPARSTSSAALVSTDATKVVINTSGGMTIANATGALGDGYAASALAVAAATLTPTTATINGNATEPLGINQGISLFSLSGEYYALLGMPEVVASAALCGSSGRVATWVAGTTSQYFRGDCTLATTPAGANPTGTIGTSAVNGSATTWMRSDAAPAIPQCSSSTFGACKVDNTTITASSGVISATAPVIPQAITWVPGINPNNIPIFRANGVRTVTAIVCRPEVAAGGTATVSVYKAASGTAISAGTILHSGSCNANGTAATDQTLTLVGGATDVLAAGDTIGITTTGTTIWTSSGVATGVVTVYIQ